jgi:hypothetical protein
LDMRLSVLVERGHWRIRQVSQLFLRTRLRLPQRAASFFSSTCALRKISAMLWGAGPQISSAKMSALGHSLQTHSALVPINVRCSPNSDSSTAVLVCPLSATSGHQLPFRSCHAWSSCNHRRAFPIVKQPFRKGVAKMARHQETTA